MKTSSEAGLARFLRRVLLRSLLMREERRASAIDSSDHLEAIGASDVATPLLEKAGVEPNQGIINLGDRFVAAAMKRFCARGFGVRALA